VSLLKFIVGYQTNEKTSFFKKGSFLATALIELSIDISELTRLNLLIDFAGLNGLEHHL
jgi:hypothetical protein